MIPRIWTSLLLACALCGGTAAMGQSLRVRTGTPAPRAAEAEGAAKWSGYARYSIMTDYAEAEQPRLYTHVIGGGAGYAFSPEWTLSGDLIFRTETLDGQVQKGAEETRVEKFEPSTAVELNYEGRFARSHSYSFLVHGEPLWDEPSRLEGHRGIVGGGAELALSFFARRYVISQLVDVSEMINTYHSNLAGDANPDMFYTYKLVNSVRLGYGFKFAYSFGAKITRRLDASSDYNYANNFQLGWSRRNLALSLLYHNGGFTDDGTVKLWYVDQYRRVAQLLVNYTF